MCVCNNKAIIKIISPFHVRLQLQKIAVILFAVKKQNKAPLYPYLREERKKMEFLWRVIYNNSAPMNI